MSIAKSVFTLFLGLVLMAGMSPVIVSARPAMPSEGPAAAAQPAPEITARVALAVDLTNGLQLFNRDGDASVAPASTVKIVTALVARAILNLDEEIIIDQRDLVLDEDYSKMGLELGDIVTVRALLYGTLLSSGGDAALALARAAGQRLDPATGDPVQRFVDEMNAYGERNGMLGSHFSNPVGIDADDSYMAARDLVRATEQVLDNWELAQIVATPEITVAAGGPNAREIYLFSTNQLVLNGESFGIKTGTTEVAGECLVNVTRMGDHTVVTVIMGSQDRYADTQALLDAVGQRYNFVSLGVGASSLGATDELAGLGLAFPIRRTITMTPDQAATLTYELQLSNVRSPRGKSGVVVFRAAEREVLRLPVYSTEPAG
ncbi:hypothetical protein BH23CHL1_BH23CHL1_01110 [soil metagenome]